MERGWELNLSWWHIIRNNFINSISHRKVTYFKWRQGTSPQYQNRYLDLVVWYWLMTDTDWLTICQLIQFYRNSEAALLSKIFPWSSFLFSSMIIFFSFFWIIFVLCYIFWRRSRRRRGCLAVLFFLLHSGLFSRNILEQYVFKTTLCIIFLSLFLLKSIFFYYILKEEKQRVFGGTLNQAETCLLSSHWAALLWGEPPALIKVYPCNLPQSLCWEGFLREREIYSKS